MSYDLHIVRTKDWTAAGSAPVTKQDDDALIAADSELAWSKTDYVEMSDDEGAVTRYWMITWRGQPCGWWKRNQIQCAGPYEPQVSKLVQMSQALRAHVIGDDGEEYPLEQQSAPRKPTSAAPAPTRWPFWKRLLAAFLLGCVLLALKLLMLGG